MGWEFPLCLGLSLFVHPVCMPAKPEAMRRHNDLSSSDGGAERGTSVPAEATLPV